MRTAHFEATGGRWHAFLANSAGGDSGVHIVCWEGGGGGLEGAARSCAWLLEARLHPPCGGALPCRPPFSPTRALPTGQTPQSTLRRSLYWRLAEVLSARPPPTNSSRRRQAVFSVRSFNAALAACPTAVPSPFPTTPTPCQDQAACCPLPPTLHPRPCRPPRDRQVPARLAAARVQPGHCHHRAVPDAGRQEDEQIPGICCHLPRGVLCVRG